VLTTDVGEGAAHALEIELAAPLPNPASAITTLGFTLPRAGDVRLEVLDVSGRRIRTLTAGAFAAGPHRATWDLRDDARVRVRPGVYFAFLDASGQRTMRRVLVLE
jgi:flagellar hook assembly protein FlgD